MVCGVLVGSLTYQFALGELPCPLCVIQRLAFLLACVGPIGVLLRPAEGRSDWGQQARGFGMTILAALVGSAASIRQILLHIVPPDLGYGPPVLGLHLYSRALVVFGCLIASSAIGLCGIQDEPVSLPRIPVYLLCSFALVIGLTVAFATFFMRGFPIRRSMSFGIHFLGNAGRPQISSIATEYWRGGLREGLRMG